MAQSREKQPRGDLGGLKTETLLQDRAMCRSLLIDLTFAATPGWICGDDVIFVADCYFLYMCKGQRVVALEISADWRDHDRNLAGRRTLSETEPIIAFRPRGSGDLGSHMRAGLLGAEPQRPLPRTRFDRHELRTILDLYGRKVAAGEWRDYAIDMGREKAVFSAFRRASEIPLIRIEKNPRLARRQGAYSVIAATGHILKRGHDLKRVLGVLEKRLQLVGQS